MRSVLAFISSRVKRCLALLTSGKRRGAPNDDSFVCYYGCPNSTRAQKLQLKKTNVQR